MALPAEQLPVLGEDGQARITAHVHLLLGAAEWQQQDLAIAAHKAASYVSEKLSGKRKWTVKDTFTLAGAFRTKLDGITPAFFLSDPQEARARLSAFGYKSNIAGEVPSFTLINGSDRPTTRQGERQIFPMLVPSINPE